MKRLPSVFIIGVKKSGTTTLTKYLDLHQQIAMAFKAQIMNNLPLGNVLHKYHMMMPYAEPAQVVVASFPGYYGRTRHKFFKLLPFMPKNPKVIVILRDPVARAVSDYLHITLMHKPSTSSNRSEWYREGNILRSTFEETVLTHNGKVNDTLDIIRLGIYSEGLQDFINAVSRKNILILSGDYFSKNPLPTLRKVEKFLELKSFYKEDYFQYNEEKGFYCAAVPSRPDVSCMSEQKGRTHPNISNFVLTKLRDFYRSYNLRLGKEFELSPAEFEWTQQ
ncbi:Heparan sulfate glucosamine 3-O-sulfotransferase 3A1 [Holothuria leucospilota]|uniref:Heparan sulfate glucosamine 3-O-sulfotransferase 3A1 n=1 Tax=Holothuria leucospilota TaxID=206669 RepID=A0A9Q1HHM4_HOLLE|nr:Heparan sulfate glucosamine 3-O-sulfotransferase 3A1 [Holothuria leucospilota]